MKAIRIHARGGPEVMRLEEVDTPTPRAGEVLVKVAAAGVNYADLMQREGTYPLPTRIPLTLGLEVAGTVAAVGPGVAGFSKGGRVMATVRGGYAEYALARAVNVVALPDGLGFEPATALLVQGTTALLMLKAARVQPGEAVLVHAAAGGVGVLAVQLAKLMGAKPVIATASSAAKLSLAESLGADVRVNYTEAGWSRKVLEVTSGKGADLVLEMAGGRVGTESFECLAPFGRMVVFGIASGKASPIDSLGLIFKNQSVIGFALTGLPGEVVSAAARELAEHVTACRLRVLVGKTYALDEAAQAHRAMGDRSSTGKIVLRT